MSRDPFPFLSPTAPVAPSGLLHRAKGLPTPRVALVGADAPTPLEGIREAAQAGLAEPVLIGDRPKIEQAADQIGYDISDLRVIDKPHDQAGDEAARLAREGSVDAIMKGQIHTADFLKALLPSKAGLRDTTTRCGHVFHITAPQSNRALLLTDAALNAHPDIDTRKELLRHTVALAQHLGIERPRAGILSASETPSEALPNSLEAAEIAAWAAQTLPAADVAGPMALDLMFSTEAAEIKGYTSPVAGNVDIVLAPEITTGNTLFKLMVLGMGCCAGGLVLGAKVPILLTSRAQGAAARLTSAALGAVAAAR